MKKVFENNTVKLLLIAVIVFGAIFGVISATQNIGKTTDTISAEASVKKLNNLYNSLRVNMLAPKKDPSIIMDTGEEEVAVLPDISQYPFVINPATDNFLTIYASSEITGSGYAAWLSEVAESFNNSGATVDGKPVSVGVRSVPSGIGAAFIYSGKYTPDLFIPATSLWGDMVVAKGAQLTLLEKRLVGNVAGVILTKKKSDELAQKYGALDGDKLVAAVLSGDLVLGYTDALSGSDGLNFILMALRSFDNKNPLSDTAIAQFKKFQDNIPYIAYDASQLKASAVMGTLDGFVSDYLMFVNSPQLNTHVFIPFGVRHDQPLYAVGNLPEMKKQIAEAFAAYCLTPASQKSAADKGFGGLDTYAYSSEAPDGSLILQAQEAWKKEKSGSRDLTAVFVADISGSMEGSPLLKLKASLNRAATVIGTNVNIGLVTFSDEVNIALPIAKFDQNQKAYFYSAVKSMWAGGGTAMFDAIIVGEKLLTDAQKQNPNTKLMLFVLTDGETNRGHEFNSIEAITRDLRIPVYTIGYNADIDILQQVSNINEAVTMNAETENVIFKLESLFNSQM